jgi:hypothetical protein
MQWDGVSIDPCTSKIKKGTENFHPASIFVLGLRIENSLKNKIFDQK